MSDDELPSGDRKFKRPRRTLEEREAAEERYNTKRADVSSDVVTHIGNKIKRKQVFQRVKNAKKAEKKKRIEERNKMEEKLGDKAPVRGSKTKTIENMRIKEETIVEEGDSEVEADEKDDEFASYFDGEPPKTIITTSTRTSKPMLNFVQELLYVFPGSYFYERRRFDLKEIVKYATNRGFTNLIILGEKSKKPTNMLMIHLPEGPTAMFKISSMKLNKDMRGAATVTKHKPELILNNFNTRLGHRVGRMFAAAMPQDPEFTGRRVVTFHNQRDFIFFRHHRYIFDSAKKARLQEIGPRFTLKIRSVQSGTFDSKRGEYEWLWQREMGVAKRQFQL